jgi:hypothetical protein
LNARQQAVDARVRCFESRWVGPMAGLHPPGALADPGVVAGPLKSRAPPPWARSAAPQLGGPLPYLRTSPVRTPSRGRPMVRGRPSRNPTDDRDHTNSPLGQHRPVTLRRRWSAIERLTSSRTSSA